MNIISRIKSWFEPKVAATKATVRFKNGAAIYLYTPKHAGDDMKTKAYRFVQVNRDLDKEKRLRELLQNRSINAHPLSQIRMHNNQCGSFSQITMNDIMGRW